MRLRIPIVVLTGLGASCMVIVPGGNGNNDNGGSAPTLRAQMLVMVNLDPSVTTLADGYAPLVAGIQQALSLQTPRIWIDTIAVAPLNVTTTNGAQLIYEEHDPDPMSDGLLADGGVNLDLTPNGTDISPPADVTDGGSLDGGASGESLAQASAAAFQGGSGNLFQAVLSQALTYQFLPQDPNRGEQENLAELGANIAVQTVYQANGSNPDQVPVFGAPEDVFIVLTLNHLARPCGPTDTNCLIHGSTPMAYFSAADSQGNAQWLDFGANAGIPVGHVFFYSIVTQEGTTDDASFFDRCSSEPGFPQGFVDLIEPSPIAYYGPFTGAYQPSNNAIDEDFCVMFGSQAASNVVLDTHQIVSVMSNG